LRDRAPRRIQADADGGWRLVVDGEAVGWVSSSAEEAAVEEAARTAAVSPDARFAMMRTDHVNGEVVYPTLGLYVWNIEDPDVGEESELPVGMQQGTGHDMIFYRGWGSATANLLATQSMAPRATALLACSGVLERHPQLHVVLVEVNAGWLAWTMSTLDTYSQ